MTRHYPSLARMAKITLYDVAPVILGSFDKGLQQSVNYVTAGDNRCTALHWSCLTRAWRHAEKKFRREGINIMTQHHVERVEAVRIMHLIYVGRGWRGTSYRTGCMWRRKEKVTTDPGLNSNTKLTLTVWSTFWLAGMEYGTFPQSPHSNN